MTTAVKYAEEFGKQAAISDLSINNPRVTSALAVGGLGAAGGYLADNLLIRDKEKQHPVLSALAGGATGAAIGYGFQPQLASIAGRVFGGEPGEVLGTDNSAELAATNATNDRLLANIAKFRESRELRQELAGFLKQKGIAAREGQEVFDNERLQYGTMYMADMLPRTKTTKPLQEIKWNQLEARKALHLLKTIRELEATK